VVARENTAATLQGFTNWC